MIQTVKAGRARIARVAARNTRYRFHGTRPLSRPEVAYDLWGFRNPSGVVGKVKGYRSGS